MQGSLKTFFSFAILLIVFCLFACSSNRNQNNLEPEQTNHFEKTYKRVLASRDVMIAQMKFVPDTVKIHLGDTLVFTNNGIVDHNVTAYPSEKWQSGNLKKGKKWFFIPKTSGAYFCTIHPVMKGYIIVTD